MIGWLILAGYVFGYVFVWRRMAWSIANDVGSRQPTAEDALSGIVIAAFFAVFWPVIAVGYVALWLWELGALEPLVLWFLKPPRHVRQRDELKARERAVQAREERIATLERELDIVS